MIKDQDEQLEEIGEVTKSLHYHAQDIDTELKKQDKQIKKMSTEMEKAHSKLSKVNE